MDLVSAICVTHPSRFGLLQRAIINFLEQDYADRELIIVASEESYVDTIRSFLRDPRLGRTVPEGMIQVRAYKIRVYMEAFMMGLGWACGNWITCWDDDNLSHPQRLTMQMSRTPKGHCTLLSEAMYYFYENNDLFVVNFLQPGGRASDRCAAASLLLHRNVLPAIDIHVRDSWPAHIVDKLTGTGTVDFIDGQPGMFLVGSAGDNLRGADYHRAQTNLPGTWIAERCAAAGSEIEGWLKAYHFPTDTVDLSGKDGQASVIDELSAWPTWLATTTPPEDWRYRIPNRDTDKLRQSAQQVKSRTQAQQPST